MRFRMTWLRSAHAILAAATLAACAQPTETVPSAVEPSGPVIGSLVIYNNTSDTLTDVRLRVIKTREFVTCSFIISGGKCVTTFPLRRYQGTPVQVLWERSTQPQATRPFVVPLPDPLPPDAPLEVVVAIGGATGFNAFMRPI